MTDPLLETESRQSRSLERSKSVSKALTHAARKARFSSRSRLNTTSRSAPGLNRVARLVLLGVMVAVPNILSIAYFGFIASDQYESDARFTVSSGLIPKMDDLGSVTGVPALEILQDTQVAVSYIESQALVSKLQKSINLSDLYSASTIDFLSRFDAKKSIEKLAVYWGKHITTSIQAQSGIVTLKVRAFSPEDAQRIAAATVAECEAMINELNTRMFNDTVASSQRDLALAGNLLKDSRVAYEQARNEAGIVDVKTATTSLSELLTQQQSLLLKAESDYKTAAIYLSPQAPQMRIMRDKINSLKGQVDGIQAKITAAQNQSKGGAVALSEKLGLFANLELEQTIAEKRYADAAAALNLAQIANERQTLYLHQVVAPALPEQANYPHRRINIALIFAGSIAAWLITVGLLGSFRRRFR